jgi:hypothetical protein
MSFGVITTQAVPAKSGVTLLGRIVGNAGVPITQASLTSPLTIVVTDLTKEAALAGSGAVNTLTPAVSGVVFDSLQTGPLWTKDSAAAPGPDGLFGYNFAYLVPAANFNTPGDKYQLDVKFIPVVGEQFVVSFTVPTLKVYA